MYEQSSEYAEIGQQIIKEIFPELKDVQIAWLSSDKEKKSGGRLVFADCAKVQERYEWCCPYDFIITVYEPNVAALTEKQLRILLEHEILHIGADKAQYYIRPHDYEEFRQIIEKYGIDWAGNARTIDYALLDD